MSISFNCKYCGKKIEAKDSAAGKTAKCPSCEKKIQVPKTQEEEDSELKLAPVDQSEEEKKKQLIMETYKLEQEILKERNVPEETSQQNEKEAADTSSFDLNEKELTQCIINYLTLMANGDLVDAEAPLKAIVPAGEKAIKILDQIALSDIPEPELEDIPPQVLSGLIRTLRTKIKQA